MPNFENLIKFEDLLNNDIAKGVAIGLGVAATAFLAAPALRPVARAAVKSGILFYERSRELLAEAGESFEDLVAEVRAELAAERFATEAVESPVGETLAETAETNV